MNRFLFILIALVAVSFAQQQEECLSDACGVCNGNNVTCAGCDGVPNSGLVVDLCGVCGGDNTQCLGCDGVLHSGKVYDRCGGCDGLNRDLGCDNVCYSGLVNDRCGVCNGSGCSCAVCGDGVIDELCE